MKNQPWLLIEGCTRLGVRQRRGTVKTGPSNRRSSRMALNARITLSGHDPAKCPFTTPAQATKLNRYGAAIQLNRELLIGSTIVLRNTHHAQAPARVVTCVTALQGVYTYGVEFLEADAVKKNFWGIYFLSPVASKCYGVECFNCHNNIAVGTYLVNNPEDIIDVRLPVSPIQCHICGRSSVYFQTRLIHFLAPKEKRTGDSAHGLFQKHRT